MRNTALVISLGGALGFGACGSSDGVPGNGTAATEAQADGASISQETVDTCAGFDLARAAALLSVPAGTLNDYSRTEGELRYCYFRQPEPPRQGVTFTLSRRESAPAAEASMARERDTMGAASRAIDRVTGSASAGPATEDLSAIGDEAFYSPLNEALMFRVGNVIAQVTEPPDMALKKQVAEDIVAGLRR
jgi:hypothetical protein